MAIKIELAVELVAVVVVVVDDDEVVDEVVDEDDEARDYVSVLVDYWKHVLPPLEERMYECTMLCWDVHAYVFYSLSVVHKVWYRVYINYAHVCNTIIQ